MLICFPVVVFDSHDDRPVVTLPLPNRPLQVDDAQVDDAQVDDAYLEMHCDFGEPKTPSKVGAK